MEKTAEKSLKRSDFQAILAWYEDMGVISTCEESPINWLEDSKTIDQSVIKSLLDTSKSTINPQIHSSNQTSRPQNIKSAEERANTASAILAENNPQSQRTAPPQREAPLSLPSLEKAKELANQCSSLEELRETLAEFDGCGLKRTAKNLVFYRGEAKADLMIIGEAPGREEDIVGKPFVGAAGQLLDRMLKAIDIDSNSAHITNLVYWRPPGNRAPTAEETAICRPFLDKQIELVQPKHILLLGGEAAKQIYQTTTGITKLRGKWKKIPDSIHKMDTLATFHPAYLLRTPIAKRLVWHDLQLLRDKLANL
ncbi:MAG: uracil-DNA glycosylase [Rhizobiales bacterium]|nr:uracil-DNA glycosylase [Hyphomicrobiales bacterium]